MATLMFPHERCNDQRISGHQRILCTIDLRSVFSIFESLSNQLPTKLPEEPKKKKNEFL
jgi:hypothetical protein